MEHRPEAHLRRDWWGRERRGAQQQGDFRRGDGDHYIDQQRESGEAGAQSHDEEGAADDFQHADEGGHDLRGGNPQLEETPHAQRVREDEFHHALPEEHATGHEPNQEGGWGSIVWRVEKPLEQSLQHAMVEREVTATRAGCDRVPEPACVPVHNDSFGGGEWVRSPAAAGGRAFGDSYRFLPGNIPAERGNVAWGIKRSDVQSSLGSWQHGDVLTVERHRTRSRLWLHGGKMRRVQPSLPRAEHDPLLLVFLTSCHVFGLAVPHETLKGFPEL